MPGTCAEALCHNSGLIFRDASAAVLLATPDTPLGCPGGTMLRRRVVAPFTPAGVRYYVNVADNYWHTNFSILKAGKLVLRHWIRTGRSQAGVVGHAVGRAVGLSRSLRAPLPLFVAVSG